MRVAGDGQSPRQLDGLGDPDALAAEDPRIAPGRPARVDDERPGGEVEAVVAQLDPQRLRELAGPGAELLLALHAAPRAHQVDPGERLQGADQHRGPHAGGLADGVQQRVDAVGAVDVRAPRGAEEGRRSRGEPHVGVTGGLAVVVGLGLDDHPRDALVLDDAADQRAGDLEHGPVVEVVP